MSFPDFVRREVEGISFYCCRALERLPFLRHGFSTRHGGVSRLPLDSLNLSHVHWDTSERVEENRRLFLAALDLEIESLATLSQIHSDQVHILEEKPVQWNRQTRGDAMISRRPGVSLGIQVADCFPVLIVDPMTECIAAAHAGWRGILSGIVPKTAERMKSAYGCAAENFLVAIGPGIGACCFEVGAEVWEAFETEFPGANLVHRSGAEGKYLVDLGQALKTQLTGLGIPGDRVYDLEACTRCNPDQFFSYRGEGPRSGRMMGIIAKP